MKTEVTLGNSRPTALIGHTGFVGSTLSKEWAFDEHYNSANIDDIRGREFDLIVCAGIQAKKWWANQHPEEDRQGIERLQTALASVQAERFVLISTIDVYPDPGCGSDESADLHGRENHAYGLHRLAFEDWARTAFSRTITVRLAALFGQGLKKNVIYDLLENNQVEKINPNTSFQWYDLALLASDLRTVLGSNLDLVNLMPEPLETSRIIDSFFPGATVNTADSEGARYDVRTRHADLFDQSRPYRMTAEETLQRIGDFVALWNDGKKA